MTREDYRKLPPAELDALLERARTTTWSAGATNNLSSLIAAMDQAHEMEIAVYLQIGDRARS